MSDVSIANVADHHVLTWSTSENKWVNAPTTGGSTGSTAGRIFYFAYSQASDIATWKKALDTPSANTESSATVSLTGTGNTVIATFVSEPGEPNQNLPAGTAWRDIWYRVGTNNGVIRIFFELGRCESDGSSQTVLRSGYSDNLPYTDGGSDEIIWTITDSNAFTFTATQRIFFRISVARVSGPGTVSATVYFEGTQHASRVQTTMESVATHTHVSADISDATDAATANKIVKRDASGNASFYNVYGNVGGFSDVSATTGSIDILTSETIQSNEITSAGAVSGVTLIGNGTRITSLDASNISSGSLSDARLSANIPLLNANNIFIGLNTVTAASSSTKALIVKGASSQTANLLEWQNNAGSGLGSVKVGGYTNARLTLNTTLSSSSYTASDGTDNAIEVYDNTDKKYKFSVRPRRAGGSSLTDIHLDPATTRIYATDSETNGGSLSFYYQYLYFQGTYLYFNGENVLMRLNSANAASTATQVDSSQLQFQTSLWNAGAVLDSPRLYAQADTSTDLKHSLVYSTRNMPGVSTESHLLRVHSDGYFGINIGSTAATKAGAALEVRIATDTTDVAHSTVTQRNRKRSSLQTGNLFECVDESANVQFAVSASGLLQSNKVSAGTLTTQGKYLPIYNGSGVLEGYIPIYSTIS